jgi:phenylpropionate dioxygenase-like ring-hydroxylating dioxygenase large terminal subunit
MSNLIKPIYYSDSKHTKIEFDKIFSNQWVFAAMEDDLLENNSFITLSLFGYPIVIQNFKGQIKAFQNICPHRFNLIQTKITGKRPFVCTYHRWSFDSEGRPNKKSLLSKFDVESDQFKKACVKGIKIEKVGKFFFINLSNSPITINKYLGDFYSKLLEISSALSSKHFFEDDKQNANWKVIIENVLEAYHCPSIHQTTLFGMGYCVLPETNQQFDLGHSMADYPKNIDFKEESKLRYLEKRVFKHNSFRHYFIFPNLVISSTEGKSIYIGNILPINQNSTLLRKRYFDIQFTDTTLEKKVIHKAFLEMVKTSINSILKEDKELLEQVQRIFRTWMTAIF